MCLSEGFRLQDRSMQPQVLSEQTEQDADVSRFFIDNKRVAIVGSRDYNVTLIKDEWGRDIRYQDLSEVIDFIGSLPEDVTIVSGGARGVDSAAKQAAGKFKLKYKEWPAEWSIYGKQAPFIRNMQIVHDVDIVICFWDKHSGGTKHTIDYAESVNVKVIIM